jgi:hypothetical protein
MQCIVADTSLVLVLDQVPGGRLSKVTSWSLTVNQRLACLFDSLG